MFDASGGFGTSSSAGGRLHNLMARLSPRQGGLDDQLLLAELARVIGLADAIQLHGLLKEQGLKSRDVAKESLAGTAASVDTGEAAGLASRLRDEVLGTRQSLLDMLAESCGEAGSERFLRWPNLEVAVSLDGLTPAQRLERFYIRLQQTMQVRIQELRQSVCKQVGLHLPRLIELDAWLEQALMPHLEKGLAVVPRQLGRYCANLLGDVSTAVEPEQTSRQTELRRLAGSLFIAEMDVRLEPVLGLVDALDDNQRTD